jgi:hypothetical protein
LDLLGGNSYRLGKLKLRYAEHSPALSNLPTNRLVDGRRSARLHAMGWLDTTLHSVTPLTSNTTSIATMALSRTKQSVFCIKSIRQPLGNTTTRYNDLPTMMRGFVATS